MLNKTFRSSIAGLLYILLILSASFRPVHTAPSDLPSAASFYVPSLPDLHQDSVHPLHLFAGHLPSDPNAKNVPSTVVTSHLFFVMVKNRKIADKERVMFWFNGGPGCSSFDGLMMEVGPWRMDGQGGFKTVEGGWEEYTTMVYVDQPAGTGFSYTSTDHYVHSLEEASSQYIEFLRNFYYVFPDLKNLDTYLGGESFAGQYIPYFAKAILDSDLGISLLGIAIGNGWIDAEKHYRSYLDYAVKHGIIEENSDAWKEAKSMTDTCVSLLAAITDTVPIDVSKCNELLKTVLKSKSRIVDGKNMCVNIYDVRYEDTDPACGMNWPPDIHPITTYLDRPDVVRALHATAHSESWVECRGRIHQEFDKGHSNSSITVLPGVLEKISVLIFAGDQDFICNYMGLEAMIQAMTWNGNTGLGTVQTQSWSVGGNPAGTWVSSRNLTYVKVFNASHMAPYDVPHVTHDMILRFMGMNFSAVLDGSARIPSSIGNDAKPLLVQASQASPTTGPVSGKTPEQDKAKWEAYYNAGSAALVLLLISLAIGTFLWCRVRRRRLRLPIASTEEENIPLNASINDRGRHDDEGEVFRQRKGKERAEEPPEPPIFDVGDSDDEDIYKSDPRNRDSRV